jgi:hypothetical protein
MSINFVDDIIFENSCNALSNDMKYIYPCKPDVIITLGLGHILIKPCMDRVQ